MTFKNNSGSLVRKNKGRRSSRRQGRGDSVGKYFGDAWSLAKRTAVGLNEIRKLINIETKYVDSTGLGTVDYAGGISPITQIAQGLDINNRVGDSIRLQHIEVTGNWFSAGATYGTACRFIVFRDLAQNGSIPLVSDVLAGTTTQIVNAPINYLNLDRFSILFDEVLFPSAISDGQVGFTFKTSHQGHVRYLGTTAAAASNGRGSVYVLYVSDRTASNLPTLTWYARVAFTDD